MFKSKFHGIAQEVILPDFSDDDNTTTTTTKSRRVSFGTNFIKEFIVGSAVSAECVSEYEQAFSSSDSSNANSSHSAVESSTLNQNTFVVEDNHVNHQVVSSINPLETDSSENVSKGPKFASTICFSADSPTADMEFTEGCITLAKSILDKKNKEMTVIIQAKPKMPLDQTQNIDETKFFEGSQCNMNVTHCFKSKEIRKEERKFDEERTKVFSEYNDEMDITRCSNVFPRKQINTIVNDDRDISSDESGKENKIPLDMIINHFTKDESDLENSLFHPKKSLNDVLNPNLLNISVESENLNLNESMDISNNFQNNFYSALPLNKSNKETSEPLEEWNYKNLNFQNELSQFKSTSPDKNVDMECEMSMEMSPISDPGILLERQVEVAIIKTTEGKNLKENRDNTQEISKAEEEMKEVEQKKSESLSQEEQQMPLIEINVLLEQSMDIENDMVIDAHISVNQLKELKKRIELDKPESKEKIIETEQEFPVNTLESLEQNNELPELPEEVNKVKLDESVHKVDTETQNENIILSGENSLESELLINKSQHKDEARREEAMDMSKSVDVIERPAEIMEIESCVPPERLSHTENLLERSRTSLVEAAKDISVNAVHSPFKIKKSEVLIEEPILSDQLNEGGEEKVEEVIKSGKELNICSQIKETNIEELVMDRFETNSQLLTNLEENSSANVVESMEKNEEEKEKVHNSSETIEESERGIEMEVEIETNKSKPELIVKEVVTEVPPIEDTDAKDKQDLYFEDNSMKVSEDNAESCEKDPPLIDSKVLANLNNQSAEPGCVWTMKTVKYNTKDRSGEWAVDFKLLDSFSTVSLFLEVPVDNNLDSCSIVKTSIAHLNEEKKLKRKEYRPTIEFGFQQQKKYLEHERKMMKTILNVPYFLDQMNLFTIKLNAYLEQIYSILTMYPGSRLQESTLSFRLFSFPIFFSVTVFVDLSDFYRLSKYSLSYEYDFGELNENTIGNIFEECLKVKNSLCEFIIRSTKYLIDIERQSGVISKRNHIRLLPLEFHL